MSAGGCYTASEWKGKMAVKMNEELIYAILSAVEEIPEGKVSLENDMIPKWMSEGRQLGGFVNDGYFIDIGVPEDYFRFIEDMKRGVVVW